ncbi:MAG: rhomboid family intramembrane serine protease [Acidobacteria bacterium]|nr:rhomboid family intramembrane serine protease [Acidobacteriota bacterium]
MIPLRDTIRSRSLPIFVFILLFLNSFVFVIELTMQNNLDSFIHLYGFVPKRFFFYETTYDSFFSPVRFLPIFSSMFLHGGFVHFFGNMIFLWVFADNVEDHFGKLGFLTLYFSSGVFACLVQGLTSIRSEIPMIGASGAIAGVLGSYFILFPHSRIYTLIPIFIFPLFVEVPAPIFLVYWFFVQFFNGTLSLAEASWTGVAFWAHIGGFLCGILFTLFFGRRKRIY